MRSVIKDATMPGVAAVVDQQFEVGLQILGAGLVPILEPEVDIHSRRPRLRSRRCFAIDLLAGLDRCPMGSR
jgi:fructose-bisphosphate aldolase class I